jgi:hypothetical protein
MNRLIFVFCLSFLFSNFCQSQTVTIYRAGTATTPIYSSIKNAVFNSIPNDSLVLSADTFKEKNININYSLSLTGTFSATKKSLIDPSDLNDSSIILFTNPSHPASLITLKLLNIDITNGFANNGFDSGGGAIFTGRGTSLIIDGFSKFYKNNAPDSSLARVGSRNGGAIYAEGDVFLKGNTILSNNRAINGGAVFSTKRLEISGNVIIEGNDSKQNGGGLFILGEAKILDSSVLKLNTANKGGACFADNSLIFIRNSTQVNGNFAKQMGGAFYLRSTYFRMMDSVILTNNRTDTNIAAAIYCFGNNDVSISGGQITGNRSTKSIFYGLGMAFFNDSLTGTSSIIKINNARIFNPKADNTRQNEFFNLQNISAFLSDSTWWGESDTSNLIYNSPGASVAIRSWIVCEWFLNDDLPIGSKSVFPLEAKFKLYTGASIPSKMFWMLEGYFSASAGSFSPNVSLMNSANTIQSTYSGPISSAGVFFKASVDADSFNKSAYVIGLNIQDQQLTSTKKLSFFPNPAKDQITIFCAEKDLIQANLRITDMLGKTIVYQKIQFIDQQVKFLLDLLPGVYTFSIDGLNQNIYQEKMIIQ